MAYWVGKLKERRYVTDSVKLACALLAKNPEIVWKNDRNIHAVKMSPNSKFLGSDLNGPFHIYRDFPSTPIYVVHLPRTAVRVNGGEGVILPMLQVQNPIQTQRPEAICPKS